MGAPDDELKWIRASLTGDADAYGELVRRYQKMIHAVAYRMTGSMEDAEDVSQESFLRAYAALGTFRSEAKFSTWLCRIAVNTCLTWRTRESKRESIHKKWSDDVFDAGGPETHATADDSSARVQAALNRLPAKQRAAIVLTVYEGMNHAEAARVSGCTEATISWRVFAARNKLKRWLKSGRAHE